MRDAHTGHFITSNRALAKRGRTRSLAMLHVENPAATAVMHKKFWYQSLQADCMSIEQHVEPHSGNLHGNE